MNGNGNYVNLLKLALEKFVNLFSADLAILNYCAVAVLKKNAKGQ